MLKVVCVILALLGLPLLPLQAAPGDIAATLSTGRGAPDFELPVARDKKIKLSDFRGQWLVLYFYPQDMTPGCTIEAQRFQRDLERFKQLNAQVVGVSADPLDSHSMFSKKEGLTFPLASDAGGRVARAYGSWYGSSDTGSAARNTYLIDPQGKVARVFTRVNPMRHSEEVLAALSEQQVSR
ncbi:MAG: peroxiredoxin [Gemmatimonadaceae bacterium]|nr:peroxiredoxin [Gloeobacterales cyanobacterium ES-bin-141]